MGSYDGYIVIGTKIDTSGVETGLNKINTSINKSTESMGNSINKTFNLLKNSIIGAGIVLAVRQITKELGNAVSRLDTMKNYVNVMSNLGIGSKDAEASIKRLSEALKGLPTSLDQAAMSVQRFSSSNKNVKASTEMFLALNNAILAGGASMQTQATALEQVSQAYAKGKPDMMEWRTMMTAMPAQLNQVAQVMGYGEKGAAQLGEALRSGAVSMNEFMTTLVKMNKQGIGNIKSLEEQARNSTGGINTAIYNVRTAITRGLADIMDTIGRSNIAGFFDGIRSAIDKVIPYIQAFIKLIKTAIAYILALFGKKMKKETDQTTSSMESFGGAVVDASKDMDGASGSAKKLNKELKQLASFDEMNVLQDNAQSGGGSGGGSSVGGGADLTDIDLSAFDGLDEVGDKLDKIYEKMLKWAKWFTEDMNIEPLVKSIQHLGDALDHLKSAIGEWLFVFIRDFIKPLATYVINNWLPRFLNDTADAIDRIDFTTITKAFSDLWKALEPFMEKIGDGFLWFYENVLIPVGVWAMNTALPKVIQDIAKAFEFLNTMIDNIAPIFQYLWDNILKPLGEWTGEAFADTLRELGETFEMMAKNKGVQVMLTGVVLLLTNLVAIALVVINVIIELINTFIDLGQKVGEVVNNIFNICSTIATFINTKVIQPVKQLFAPVVSFFKSIFDPVFENVKATFNNIVELAKFSWNAIKSVFSVVGNFFKTKFTDAFNNVKTAFSPITNFFKGIFDTIKSLFGNVGTAVGNIIGGTFKKIINSVISGVENVLNAPIRAINSLINTLSTLPGVKLTRLSTFRFPRLAKGGIINMPGKGVPIGSAIAGERGQEAVLPLTDSQQMQLLGEAIGRYITINANIPVSMNGRVIGRELRKVENESDFAFNR